MIFEHPSLSNRLSSPAETVHYPEFESGVVKIQDQKLNLLTENEKKAVSSLLIEVAAQNTVKSEHGIFLQIDYWKSVH